MAVPKQKQSHSRTNKRRSQHKISAPSLNSCPQCGANLNDDPDHAHETAPDPRWSKLSEIRFD